MSIGNEIPLQPTMDWDFSLEKLGWFYHQGAAGYIQLGIFDLKSTLKSLEIWFTEKGR